MSPELKALIEEELNDAWDAGHEGTGFDYYSSLKRITALLDGCAGEVEAVAWFTDDYRDDRSATTYDPLVADRWRMKGWPVYPLYTHPPAVAVDEAALIEALRKIADFKGDPNTPIRNSVKKSAIARAALTAAIQRDRQP